MDPHQIHNQMSQMNSNGINPQMSSNGISPSVHQQALFQQQQQQQQQYNHLFAPQQFMNMNLPGFYSGMPTNQMLNMNMEPYMQQQQLLHAMQQQHPQQQLLQQQQIDMQQNQMLQQQQILQQQHQANRFGQQPAPGVSVQASHAQTNAGSQSAHVQAQPVQQQPPSQQQRLLEEQKRQMEMLRQQRLAQERAQEEARMREQRQREAEEAARRRAAEEQRLKEEAEQRARLEAEMREQQRLQEEAARKEEEERQRLEKERKEKEKLIKFQEEQRAREREALEAAAELQKKAGAIPGPMTLLGTTMTNLLTLLPFPSENMGTSKVPGICRDSEMNVLGNTDPALVSQICEALTQCDINEIKLRHDYETNDLSVDDLPPLIKAVLAQAENALDVESHLVLVEDPMLLSALHTEMLSTADGVVDDETSASILPCISHVGGSPPRTYVPSEPVVHPDRDQTTLRKQMVSVGKQPKAQQGGSRKKRDMVEELYDSLTDYFDPSQGRRSRRKAKTFEEEQLEKRDLELVNQMECESGPSSVQEEEGEHSEEPGPSGENKADEEEEVDEGKFFDKKKGKKRKHEEIERPPTPTAVIEQRDLEWQERQKRRMDKQRRRQRDDESDQEMWNHDVMAEQNSLEVFENTIEEIVEDVDIDLLSQQINNEDEEGAEMDKEYLIDNAKMEMLRVEAQKLKEWKKLNKVNVDRLIKLITILERNIRDVIPREGQAPLVTLLDEDMVEEDDPTTRELVDERLTRAADAACTALIVMTSTKMPKQVFIEDAIDRSIQLCKQYLNYIVFPASDTVFRSPNKQKKMDEKSRNRRKAGQSSRTPTAQRIYLRMADLIGCFAELVRAQPVSDMVIHQMCTIATSTFFVNNVGEVQWKAMRLLSNIFNKYDDTMRHNILTDIVNSLHRLPCSKTTSNSFRLASGMWLNNVTVLIMQLIQSTIEMPKRKKKDTEDDDGEKYEFERADKKVKASFDSASRMAATFLGGFLQKCCSKGEDDNRRLFESFLSDLLGALHKPEWPAAEFLLSILGNMLVKHYRSTKGTEIALRTASLEYLGMITARLKRDVREAADDAQRRHDVVVKTLLYEEMDDPPENIADVDISHMTVTDKLRKLEQSLIDYLILDKEGDVSVEFAVSFYAGYWYKETAEDMDKLRAEFKARKKKADDITEKELRKLERRQEKLDEKGRAMKEYLISLVDKKQLRKRIENIRRNGMNLMLESDAAWTVKYLASRRELTQSGFDNYLKQILFGVISESTVSLRTRAMKCLTQIIEADHSVLGIPEVQNAVTARMVDPNAQVREATIELLGRYLVSRPDFIPKYYRILLERIKDAGTAVRKRVIRIMRELTEKNPELEKIPEMLSRIVRRIADEDGVKKLVIETFQSLWFLPLRERDQPGLLKRVMAMTATAEICSAEGTVDHLEMLMNNILKSGDKNTVAATRQIVDCLVDNVLALEGKMALDNGVPSEVQPSCQEGGLAAAKVAKSNQDRMLACLTTLSLFSKVRPELLMKHAETLQPYLSMAANSPAETQVLRQVVDMLRRVIPLISHPSEQFVDSLEESLATLIVGGKVVIVESAVECAGALHEKFPRRRPKITEKFLKFLGHLNQMKTLFEREASAKTALPEGRIVMLSRAIFCVGLLCRHFNFDRILADEIDNLNAFVVVTKLDPNPLMDNVALENESEPRAIRDNVFSLLNYFSRHPVAVVSRNSLTSIGHLCAQYAEYLTRPEVRSMYMTLLVANRDEYLSLKILTLRNLETFLINEESKMQKHNEEWQKRKETEDLKEMDQAGSGLGSAVIQIYWHNVLNCYFHREKEVRSAAVQVAWRTLNQGLVTPGSSIPTLIAMMTDPLQPIRNKVENLLKEIDTKYQGMVQSKAVAGIRIAFKLHSMIHTGERIVLRGIRAVEGSATANTAGRKTAVDEWGVPKYTNDGQAVLSGLYQSLRTNRQQRRSFLGQILRLFSDDSRDKLTLAEWIFVADNIAMFPYQVMDEPLYVIHQIDSIVALSGESIINQFKGHLLPKQGPPSQQNDDDVDFEPEAVYRRLPEDKTYLFELMNNSQACFILLYLKNFLMRLYGFTEQKVQEYSPSEAAKVYEKACGRKNVHMFHPQSAIAEMDPGRIADRDTFQGHCNLSHQICNFRKMLLSLDRGEDEEEEVPVEGEKREESEGEGEGEGGEVTEMDESDAPSEASHQ